VQTSIGCGVFRPIGGDGPHREQAHVAQLAEHVLGKDEVTGSIPVMGSMTGELTGKKIRTKF
jgi:hypothetical protein